VIGPTLCVPDAVLLPVQPPEALHVFTLSPVHVSVELALRATLRGFADKVTEGLPPDATATATVLAAVVPPEPAHVSVKLEFAVRTPVLCVPEVPLEPVHAPDAAQLVAFAVDQVSCDDAPDWMLVGDAASVTVGAGFDVTVTATDRLILPPAPLQASAKLELVVSALVVNDPDVAFVPVHAPDAVQDVAFEVDHVNRDVAPDLTDVGDAENVSVGAGVPPPVELTVTVVDTDFVPPLPLQLNLYVVFAVRAPVLWLPLRAFVPLQPPEAVQLVELVELHVNFDELPEATVFGAAVNVTEGHGTTVPPIFFTTVPPAPTHVSRNVTYSLGVKGPMLAVPESGFAPDQAADAVQVFALVVDHFRGNTPFTVLPKVKVSVGAAAANAAGDSVMASAIEMRNGPKAANARGRMVILWSPWKEKRRHRAFL
jgi:hypothetical protein